jgi:tight adherence protein C
MLLPILAFLCGTLLITGVGYAVLSTRRSPVHQRLQEVLDVHPVANEQQASSAQIAAFLTRMGQRGPKSLGEISKLKLRLVQAGYRQTEALPIFLGIRVSLGLAMFVIGMTPLVLRPSLLIALPAMGFGYLIPGMVLARMAKRRQHRIRLSLADALDLLVVSVEAGLGLDQALARVAQELSMAYPDLTSELRLVNLELLAGKGRSDALRNLADRTGVDDLTSLVAMLIQTDKFGTSVANSLRVFSEILRTKRRQRAEEAAAKTGVKMVFPLVFCIFPAIWIVTIGPAAIKFIQVIGPMSNK